MRLFLFNKVCYSCALSPAHLCWTSGLSFADSTVLWMKEKHARLGTGPQLPPLHCRLLWATLWSLRPPQATNARTEALTWGGIGHYLQHISPWDTEVGRDNNPCPSPGDTAAKLND